MGVIVCVGSGPLGISAFAQEAAAPTGETPAAPPASASDLELPPPASSETTDADKPDQTPSVDESKQDAEAQRDAEPEQDTEPEQDAEPERPFDPKRDLMGEFSGQIDRDGTTETIGLQLRPIGGRRFDGLVYAGGLPGKPGCKLRSARSYVGLYSGDTLILSGGNEAIFVKPDGCTLVGSDGGKLGTLDRVRRISATLGAAPPEGAYVVFGGPDNSMLQAGTVDPDGNLEVGATASPMPMDFDLHVEFLLPEMFERDGQKRGNSGVYLQSRYECQVLDSFAQAPQINGCGALYKFKKPDLNMTLPPGVWQTYDIRFTAPRWAAGGEKLSPARITSWLNGVKVQDDVELNGPTGAGRDEEPNLLPTRFQDHGDPVRFRNIWMVDRGLNPDTTFPVVAPEDSSDGDAGQSAEGAPADTGELIDASGSDASDDAEPTPTTDSADQTQPAEQDASSEQNTPRP